MLMMKASQPYALLKYFSTPPELTPFLLVRNVLEWRILTVNNNRDIMILACYTYYSVVAINSNQLLSSSDKLFLLWPFISLSIRSHSNSKLTYCSCPNQLKLMLLCEHAQSKCSLQFYLTPNYHQTSSSQCGKLLMIFSILAYCENCPATDQKTRIKSWLKGEKKNTTKRRQQFIMMIHEYLLRRGQIIQAINNIIWLTYCQQQHQARQLLTACQALTSRKAEAGKHLDFLLYLL